MSRDPAPAVAVVGAAGFIGGALCRGLARAGVPAIGLTRPRGAADEEAVVRAMRHVDHVIYAAGTVTPATAAREPHRIAADELALRRFLEACKRGGRHPRVILIGSGGTVYAPELPPPYTEDGPTRPTGAYGEAKLASEQILFRAADHIRPAVLRLSNVYGPGQRVHGGLGVVSHWLAAAAEGRPLTVIGDPATRRDYVYVEDVVDAALRFLRLDHPPGLALLNIGAGVPTSLTEVRRVVESVVGRRLPVTHRAARHFDRPDIWLDVRAAEAALGWRATTDLPTGIGRAWAEIVRSSRVA
jgi:UDP-glucose 4-epimerase